MAASLALLLGLSACGSREPTAALRVSAAASLQEALTEAGNLFETRTGTQVECNFSGSSTLARQIEAGAPADVFLSADAAKMDGLEARGFIDSASRRDLLSNALVVVAPAHREDGPKIARLEDLKQVTRLAMAETESVPAGIYARQWLEQAGLWNAVADKVVAAEHVRSALAMVESGNVEAGIVYKTDAASTPRVAILLEAKPEEAPRIVYPVAILKQAEDADTARDFVTFLSSPEAQDIFRKHGFIVLP